MIEELINTNDLTGVGFLIEQLGKSHTIIKSNELSEKLNNLKAHLAKRCQS